MYILLHSADEELSEQTSIKLHKIYPDMINDVRANDHAMPDYNYAGQVWYSAQITQKLADMYVDRTITNNDTIIFSWFEDPNKQIVNNLNIHYNIHPKMYLLTFEGTGLWTIDNQEYVSIEMLVDY